MNTDLTAQLARLRADLHRTIELDAKRTQGKWTAHPKGVNGPTFEVADTDGFTSEERAQNAAFIAHTANLSATTAKALLRALDGLEKIAAWSEGCVVTGSFDEPGSAEYARDALAAVCALWADTEATV